MDQRIETDPRYQEIIQVFIDILGFTADQVGRNDRLGEDLGIDGDDASDLMVAYAERLKVDLSGFVFERHFGPESSAFAFSAGPKPRLVPLTVQNLYESAVAGEWRPVR